jgi:hypothetical protein
MVLGWNVCVARSKDTMSSDAPIFTYKNAVVELKYICLQKLTSDTAPDLRPLPERSYRYRMCVLINCRTGECCRYVLTKSITEKAIDVLKVQSELQRIST